MENTPVIYHSKISILIVAPMFVVFALVCNSAISSGHIAPAIFSIVALTVIVLPLTFNTVYTIAGTNLNVKSGYLINKNIDINSITKIITNNGILSAPAVSYYRIEVFYNKYDSVVISPKDKKIFVESLKQINTSIVVEL